MAATSQCGVTLLILGLLGIICGSLTLGLFDKMFDYILKTQMVLTTGSYSMGLWQKLPDSVPLLMYVYFFNVSNSAEILKARDDTSLKMPKPNLVQMGPYVYRQYQEMDNITISTPYDNTFTYYQNKTYMYQPDMSNGTLDDMVTAINPVLLGAASSIATTVDADPNAYFSVYQVNNLINVFKGKLFLTQPVRNFTFDGIVDEIMNATNQMPLPMPIPFDKFGWFYTRNNSLTYDGKYNMFTGGDDFVKTGQINLWNDDTKVPEKMFTEHCGMLNGSAGEFFPAHRDVDKDNGIDYVDLFSSDICRSIRFTYQKDVEVKGVTGYKYVMGKDLVDNDDPNNKCFNPYPDPHNPYPSNMGPLNHTFNKVPNGLFNVSACKWDSPSYVSYPHFLHGDQWLVDQFQPGNLNPVQEEMESYIVLEPMSGVPLEVAIKLQINVLTRPFPDVPVPGGNNTVTIDLLKNTETVYYPMIWFQTVTQLDDDMVGMMKLMSASPKISLGCGISAILIGLALGGVAIFIFVRTRHQNSRKVINARHFEKMKEAKMEKA